MKRNVTSSGPTSRRGSLLTFDDSRRPSLLINDEVNGCYKDEYVQMLKYVLAKLIHIRVVVKSDNIVGHKST
ncbi:CLUMA_CG012839, isoform A [Clunio marinus]|uniref:CLUMA_CG012839, isoform A n=1 Tax=Clunio marinus TaxID=568069 RepID=A0A1J1IH39_9DIPT|nr:CLUMA_CG012839, isoform A [Clunio marinus]